MKTLKSIVLGAALAVAFTINAPAALYNMLGGTTTVTGTNNTPLVTIIPTINVPAQTVYVSHGALTSTNELVINAVLPVGTNTITIATYTASSTNVTVGADVWSIPATNIAIYGYATYGTTNSISLGLLLQQ